MVDTVSSSNCKVSGTITYLNGLICVALKASPRIVARWHKPTLRRGCLSAQPCIPSTKHASLASCFPQTRQRW